ncbi:hypothetical protein QTO34_010262 [Cnephaeus nilssonii]|uniref:DNA-directed RNA polymerase I subunit RPA34 n=1 Tax=Cnephaeus nilssonii TaxID=3371016 RepID=A0AA40LE28_CNENI|nr:hypothetical protein QTO34_010262 [Eptesicus nilssonii]
MAGAPSGGRADGVQKAGWREEKRAPGASGREKGHPREQDLRKACPVEGGGGGTGGSSAGEKISWEGYQCRKELPRIWISGDKGFPWNRPLERPSAARFSCPPNFTATSPSSESTRFSLEALTGPDTELWFIQAPVDFAPDCLNGRLVPLSGSQMVKGKVAGKRHRYQVLSSGSPQAGEATLLAPSAEAEGGLTCAPAPKGSLRILEDPPRPEASVLCLWRQPTSHRAWVALALRSPASGKRKKKRHVPEASIPQEAVNGHGTLEVDTALGSSEVDVETKKKKQHPNDLEAMKPEPMAEVLEPLGVLFPSTSKKKKKRKLKETEMGVLEPEEKTVELELMVKTEPLQEPVLSPSKKRKRHQGTEGMEAVEGMRAEPQLQVKEEPQEEAIPLLSSKKKKKGKGCRVLVEPGTEAVEPERRTLELSGETMEPELPLW